MLTEPTQRLIECPNCGRIAVDITPVTEPESKDAFYRDQAAKTTTPIEEV